jgi:hypothetical protein
MMLTKVDIALYMGVSVGIAGITTLIIMVLMSLGVLGW